MEQNDLIRFDGSINDTVVLVGNGAIQNGWLPLREVLDPMIHIDQDASEVVKNIKIQNCETFHQLAILSYRFKLYRAQTLRKLIEKKMTLKELQDEGLDSVVDEFLELRSGIGHSYKKHENELTLKITEPIRSLIGDRTTFITTNWDETLWNEEEFKNLAYLHGRSSLPQSIVFPTELLIDDTMFDPMTLDGFDQCSKKFKQELGEVFRFRAIAQLMDTITFAGEAVKNAKKIVVWGFNLADYDADINTLLSANSRTDQELVVINPDFSSFGRAVGLTGISRAAYYDPVTKLHLQA